MIKELKKKWPEWKAKGWYKARRLMFNLGTGSIKPSLQPLYKLFGIHPGLAGRNSRVIIWNRYESYLIKEENDD